MKTVFLTYYFPPLTAPRATQVERLARHSSLPMRVICAATNPQAPRVGVEVSSFPDTSPKWLRMLKTLLCLPDAHRSWAMRLAKMVADEGMIGRDDVLVTFGQPMSVHLAGLYLKHRVGMRWIAHFSDPWSDNPFLLRLPFSRWRQRCMEKQVFESADRLLFTSSETVNLVMGKYPERLREKAAVLPHAFDAELYGNGVGPTLGAPLCIRYLGNFYRQRNPRRFAEALLHLHNTRPSLLENVRFELVGRWVGHARWSSTAMGLPEGLLLMKPPVPYQDSLRLMREASMLLVIDAPFERSVFFPSKLVDYLGAGRPIIAVTPPGTSADIVRNAGGIVVSPSSVETIAEGLAEALAHYRSGDFCPPPRMLIEPYAAGCVAASFDALVAGCVNEKSEKERQGD